MKKIFGFTLAEVLITLAIIGIVAAMTIPSIVQQTQKQEYVSSMKKAYSVLSQATNMVISEMGGTPDTWGLRNGATDTNRIMSYYIPHLLNIKTCKTSDTSCYYPDLLLNINGKTSQFYSSYGENFGDDTFKWTLADGTYLTFNEWSTTQENIIAMFGVDIGYNNGSSQGAFIIDVNGRKKPNQFGRDVFIFVLTNKGLAPAGQDNNSIYCNKSTTHGYGGMDCAAKVLSEGAMNY